MLKLFWIIPVILLTGCATDWHGRTESELVQSLGLPTRRMEMPEGTAFEYVKCDSTGMIIPVGNLLVNSGETCNRQLFIVKDHVVTKAFNKKYE